MYSMLSRVSCSTVIARLYGLLEGRRSGSYTHITLIGSGGMHMQTWALPYPYGLSTYFLVSHFNLKHIYTLEPLV